MRPSRWGFCEPGERVVSLRRCVLVWLFACMPVLASAQPQDFVELKAAMATVRIDGGEGKAVPVALPYVWDVLHRGTRGRASFDIAFEFPVMARSDELYGLYVPRVGNGYDIWLNGALLDREGDLQHSGPDSAQKPRYLRLPVDLLQSRNMLTVHIRTDIGRRGGLSTLYLGTEKAVYPMYMRAYGWRVLGTELVVGFSLFVGLMALAFWATQVDLSKNVERRDSFYLFAGLAELSWTVRVGDVLVERPPLDWPWWGIVPVMALGAWMYCMTQFCVRAAGWTQQPVALAFGRWVGLLAVVSPVLACLALGFGRPLALTAWYAAVLASFLLFSIIFVVRSVREGDGSRRLIALAILVNVAVGLRDFYAFRVDPGYPDNSYMRYSSVAFGLVLAYMVLARFKLASAQARDLLANLAARVSEKEMALQQSYLRVDQMAREQERTSERTRILRDMHDGVGSHISAAIRQLQSGRASHADVLQTLRDSMDQLKLTIDAMHLPPGDVAALLANLRYRLAPRFAASDIELLWEVDVLQPLARLDAQAMRQLQFMLFEALSNVLQHARARVLRIEAVAHEGVRLRIIDDGQGFDVEAPWRKGLLSLRDRAVAIDATLTISSQPGRTILEVQLR